MQQVNQAETNYTTPFAADSCIINIVVLIDFCKNLDVRASSDF